MNATSTQPKRLAVAAVVTLTLWLASACGAGDWPQFRGPELDGRSAETGLLVNWPEAGPPVLWRVDIGEGYSGISVSGSCRPARQDSELIQIGSARSMSSTPWLSSRLA